MKSPVEKQWITEEGYIACVIIHKRAGHRCGYVAVPKNHPSHSYPYYIYSDDDRREELDENIVEDINDILVHGGLTYAQRGTDEYIDGTNGMWVFGFDAGHSFDRPDTDALLKLCEKAVERIRVQTIIDINDYYDTGGTVRTLDYMVHECEKLSRQLKDIEEKYDSK